MLKVILAGFGNTQICLLVCNEADNSGHNKDWNYNQRQYQRQQFSAQFQFVDEYVHRSPMRK